MKAQDDVVVDPLRPDRDDGERLVTEGRDQELAPHQRQQAGDREQDERRPPAASARTARPSVKRRSRRPVFRPSMRTRPRMQVEQREQGDRAEQQPAAIGDQRPVAEFEPPHAASCIMTSAAGPRSCVVISRFVEAQGAPEIRIGRSAERAERTSPARGRHRPGCRSAAARSAVDRPRAPPDGAGCPRASAWRRGLGGGLHAVRRLDRVVGRRDRVRAPAGSARPAATVRMARQRETPVGSSRTVPDPVNLVKGRRCVPRAAASGGRGRKVETARPRSNRLRWP